MKSKEKDDSKDSSSIRKLDPCTSNGTVDSRRHNSVNSDTKCVDSMD